MRRLFAGIFGLVAIMASLGHSALAAQSSWQGDPSIGEARLVSAVTATGDLDVLPLGVEFVLSPGWKIYWRTPGEAGLAPVADLSQSPTPGLEGRFAWPMPKRFDAFGFDNFGYENAVILPFDVRGHVAGTPVQVTAELEALACADICVPLTATLELLLPDGEALPSPHAQALAQYAAMVPRRSDENGYSASGPSIRIDQLTAVQGGLVVKLADDGPPVADLFVEGVDGVAFKAPQARGEGLFLAAVPADKVDLAGQQVVLTVSAPPEMAEIHTQAESSGAQGTAVSALSLRIMAIAFLGGLILNLMPCVLPVLALKLSAVLVAVGAPRNVLRLRFLAGAAGIVTSFLLLAGGLAALRLAGGTVGWGIQFQNPVFLGVMIAMLGIFALSLIDRVIIPVPRFVQALAGTTARTTAGTDMATGGQPYRGDFLAGMLATILATPCSAPFVGTAVAAALSGGMVDLFGIFLAMGVGLSAPWMLVAANPSLVAMLPRPGPWMVWMKRVLALLLVGTMIWLGSVLATVVGGERAQAAGDELWQSWSMQAMQDSLAAGTPVFVDVTADWCVTCKANKALVLERDPVAGALASAVADGSLVLLRADWTRPDAEIAAFLASHGRYGIPFNMLLTPGGRNDIVFAEILTSSAIIKALENVARTAK